MCEAQKQKKGELDHTAPLIQKIRGRVKKIGDIRANIFVDTLFLLSQSKRIYVTSGMVSTRHRLFKWFFWNDFWYKFSKWLFEIDLWPNFDVWSNFDFWPNFDFDQISIFVHIYKIYSGQYIRGYTVRCPKLGTPNQREYMYLVKFWTRLSSTRV